MINRLNADIFSALSGLPELDRFALVAMQAMLLSDNPPGGKSVGPLTHWSYMYAKAMLRESAKAHAESSD